MLSVRSRVIVIVCAALFCLATSSLVYAQALSPQAAADQIRQQLFDAQSRAISADSSGAEAAVNQALDTYRTTLEVAFKQSQPDVDAALSAAFEQAAQAAGSGDTLTLAAARSQIWTGMLQGSAWMLFQTLEKGDGDGAHDWLLLRDFRTSTKFSRPGADATLAVQAVIDGKLDPADAVRAVRNDLLDTYQAQLDHTLADAAKASDNGFAMRRVEEAGLAQGYFEILAPAYREQYGADALANARAAFQALMTAGLTQDSTAFDAARQQVETLLKPFRAAPLSSEEQARRAGQFLRFISLVTLEYGRGVSNGLVLRDIEVQEALTFHQGAATAFKDLQTVLVSHDPALTAEVEGLLQTALNQIQATADPSALQATIDQLNSKAVALFPPEWQSLNNDSDVDVIGSILDQVQVAVVQGEYAQAETARLEAYAMLELGIEQRLRGFAPDKAADLESLFWGGIGDQPGLAVLIGSQGSPDEIKTRIGELKVALADAQTFLSSEKTAPEVVAGNAGIIVFREGLEAVLILASLLASLRSIEERKFRRPIVIGALLAFLATAATWWFANQILLSMMRLGERLEAIVSLIAIGVLLLITNWFFHRVYWTDWLAGFHSRKRTLVTGVAVVTLSQALGLVLLGFTSIYREGFETILFLQSLVLEAGIGMVLRGVALGLLGTAIVGFITFKLQVRLPYRRMLVLTGILIGVVLLTMVGNTVHVMQAVGWLPIKPITALHIPFSMGQWFGVYATWQGLGAQLAAAAFVIGSYFLARVSTRSHTSRRSASLPVEPASANIPSAQPK